MESGGFMAMNHENLMMKPLNDEWIRMHSWVFGNQHEATIYMGKFYADTMGIPSYSIILCGKHGD